MFEYVRIIYIYILSFQHATTNLPMYRHIMRLPRISVFHYQHRPTQHSENHDKVGIVGSGMAVGTVAVGSWWWDGSPERMYKVMWIRAKTTTTWVPINWLAGFGASRLPELEIVSGHFCGGFPLFNHRLHWGHPRSLHFSEWFGTILKTSGSTTEIKTRMIHATCTNWGNST